MAISSYETQILKMQFSLSYVARKTGGRLLHTSSFTSLLVLKHNYLKYIALLLT